MRSTLFLMLLVACAPWASAESWPRFRGHNGEGVAKGKLIPSDFSAKSGLVWKLKLPGIGNSSPVIWDNLLFVQTSSDDARERRLVCVDVRKPEILWQRSIPGDKAHTHDKNTLASSTPAVDGERVYTAFWDGKNVSLWAYSMKGEPAWNVSLGEFVSQHGAGASPVVHGDLLYFANDMDKKSTLYCFDKRTGKEVWKKERPAFRACYSTPFILERKKGEPELVVTSSINITSYDPAAGKVNWEWKWDWSKVKKKDFPLRTISATMHLDGVLYSCSGDGGGDRFMTALALGGTSGDASPTRIWDNAKDFPYVPCLLHREGRIYFINDAGFAGCYDAKTGKRIWYDRVDAGKVSFAASPVLIDDRVFAVSEQGDLFTFAAEEKGFKLLGKSSLGEPCRATPAVADGRLYLRGIRHLVCVGKNAE